MYVTIHLHIYMCIIRNHICNIYDVAKAKTSTLHETWAKPLLGNDPIHRCFIITTLIHK